MSIADRLDEIQARADKATGKHLWEYDHPYYCTEGNFLHSSYAKPHIESHSDLASWTEFKESGLYDADRDLNLLFRWDWKAWHLESPEDFKDDQEEHQLLLFFVLQRKAFNRSVYVKVTPADEPEVRAWLTECAQTTAALWQPLLGESS